MSSLSKAFSKSFKYSMNVKLLTEQLIEFLSLTECCTGSSESIHVKMSHCLKSHVAAHLNLKLLTFHRYTASFKILISKIQDF